MRAYDYTDTDTIYKPWSQTDMIRAALLEGLVINTNISATESSRQATRAGNYLDTVKLLVDHSFHPQLGKLYSLLRKKSPNLNQKTELSDIVCELHSGRPWKKMTKSKVEMLEREGIVERHDFGGAPARSDLSKNLTKLVERVYHTPQSKVLVLDNFDFCGDDNIKHLLRYSKLNINGAATIKDFASRVDLEIPRHFSGLTKELLKKLKEYGFTFNEAWKSAVNVSRAQKNRFIAAYIIKNSDGNSMRILPYELIAGTELFYEVYTNPQRRKLLDKYERKHFVKDDGFAGYAKTILPVPHRGFDPDSKTNEVTVQYMRHLLQGGEQNILEWMDTRMSCNCHSGLNHTDFLEQHGDVKRISWYLDAHARFAVLELAKNRKNDPDFSDLLVFPSHGLINMVDRLRYNVAIDSGSIGMHNISLLTNQIMKMNAPYDDLWVTNRPEKSDVLRPRYFVTRSAA